MRKLLLYLFTGILSLSFISPNPQNIHAKNQISSTQNYDFSNLEEQGLSFNYINENEFTIYIPLSMVNKEEMDRKLKVKIIPTLEEQVGQSFQL